MAEPKVRFKKDDGGSYPERNDYTTETVLDTITDYVAAGSFADIAAHVQYQSEGYAQLVRTVDLKNHFTSKEEIFVSEEAFNYLWRVNLDKECIVLPNVGNCGEVYYVTPSILPYEHNALAPNAIVVRSEEWNNRFIAYLMESKGFQEQLKLIVSPSGQTKFNKTEFKRLILSLPCLEEQQKIADFLSSVDEVISTSEQEVANLETQKRAVMKKIFSQEVRFKRNDGSDFPEWEYIPFEEIASLMTASIDPSKSGTMHCVELEHLEQGSGQRLGFVEAENQSSNKRLFETGDVLFGKLRPYLRKYWLATEEGCCSTEIWVLRPLSGVMSEYLLTIVSSDDFISVANTSEGTKMPRASWDLVANAEFPVPSFEEQRLIADFLSDFDEAIAAAKKELELWKELKKGLLQQMFV